MLLYTILMLESIPFAHNESIQMARLRRRLDGIEQPSSKLTQAKHRRFMSHGSMKHATFVCATQLCSPPLDRSCVVCLLIAWYDSILCPIIQWSEARRLTLSGLRNCTLCEYDSRDVIFSPWVSSRASMLRHRHHLSPSFLLCVIIKKSIFPLSLSLRLHIQHPLLLVVVGRISGSFVDITQRAQQRTRTTSLRRLLHAMIYLNDSFSSSKKSAFRCCLPSSFLLALLRLDSAFRMLHVQLHLLEQREREKPRIDINWKYSLGVEF